MSRLTLPLACAIALAAFAGIAVAQTRPTVPAEQRYLSYLGRVPACDDPGVLGKITSRFTSTESEYWDSGLSILGYDRVAEIGYRSTGLDYIPRRYCIARATLNNGAVSTVSYAIAEDLGFIGFPGFGVDYCVEGLDRQRAAAPGCKMKRP